MRMTAQELRERTFELGIRVVRAVDFCPEATLLEKLDSNCCAPELPSEQTIAQRHAPSRELTSSQN